MDSLELLLSGNGGWVRAKAEEKDEDSRYRMLTDDVTWFGALGVFQPVLHQSIFDGRQ